MGFLSTEKRLLSLSLQRNNKTSKVMRTIMLLKHIEKKVVLTMNFKNENESINWWSNFPCSEEWEIIHEGERKKAGTGTN